MAMVGVVSGSLYRRTESSGLVLSRRPLDAILHSSNEPCKLSHRLCHDDSTINIVLDIILLYIIMRLDDSLVFFFLCGFHCDFLCRALLGLHVTSLTPIFPFLRLHVRLIHVQH